jgi:PAS domain S-box-containing protein
MDLQSPFAPPAGLDDVLVTEKLAHRTSRPPDHEAENRALGSLAAVLAAEPQKLLQALVDTVLEVCRADSAGIGIHVPGGDGGTFRWDVVAGALAASAGGSLPRNQSPCGAAIDADSVLLFDRPHRHFPALAAVDPPIVEHLLAPFHLGGRPVGTVWVMGHAQERRFDAEDARLLTSLSRFASAGYRMVAALEASAVASAEAAGQAPKRALDLAELRCAGEALRDSEAGPSFLLKLGDVLRPLADPLEIQAEASRVLGEHLGVSRVAYGEVEEGDGDHIVFERNYVAPGVPLVVGRFRMTDFGASLLTALTEGRGVVVPEVASATELTEAERAAYLRMGIASLAGVPLNEDGRLVANLVVHDGAPRSWSAHELSILEQTAERTRAAVERARAQAALRRSEERFRGLMAASTDVVYRMSPDWSEMRHLEGREFIPDTAEPSRSWVESYLPPEDRARVEEAIREAIRTKSAFELEHRVVRIDGTVGWAFSRSVPLLDSDGEIVEWLGAASDVSRRKEAEAAVRESQSDAERQKRLYETIISSTPDLVYVFDRDYRFTFANEALLQMWGRTLEESVGRSLLEIGYEPWHAEMHEREIDHVIATREPIRGEVPFPHATLGRRIYDYIFVPVLGTDGEVEAIAGTTRDVTDRKRTEEELREAKRLAETASHAKSQFLAVMSHELRTPLTGVIGFADLLANEVLGPATSRQQEALSRIKASSWHLVSIIDEILTLTRAEAGREEAHYEVTDVAEIAREVVSILAPRAEACHLALHLQGAEDPLPAWTDPGKVRQILINLVGNAVKYTRRGDVAVEIDRSDAAWHRVHVRDTGPGIRPEDQERIFEAFTQLDSSLTRNGEGTGLGLAIGRRMARLLGGDITLRSTPGEGSTFTLLLPARPALDGGVIA